jgi:hypothetical protein
VQLRAFGDEHYHYLTDSAGYTVQYSPAAQAFVYARHDPATDTIVDTGYPVYTVGMSERTGPDPSPFNVQATALLHLLLPAPGPSSREH